MKQLCGMGWGWLAALLSLELLAAGCGTPGAPLPPSLNLPDPVTDLTAVRTGNQVALTWTMPKKNTEKMTLKSSLPVTICRREGTGTCFVAPSNLTLAPGAQGAFTDTLPAEEAAGIPRALSYFVELKNRRGRSAGLSNAAQVLAGEAPSAVAGLSAQVRKGGVVLHWKADHQQAVTTVMRLHRKLLTLPVGSKAKTETGLLAPPPEPLERTLLVDFGTQTGSEAQTGQTTGRALDQDIRFGQVYEYRAQRVARVPVDGQTLELAGPLSDALRVETLDVFPPAVPTGLAAVAIAADATSGPSIDLSWQAVPEADLAGYAVYRSEGGAWERVSPPQPVVGPAFHDSNVQPGRTYRYAVTAVDQGGHASDRSAAAEETVPSP
jgi:hypothetical protein